MLDPRTLINKEQARKVAPEKAALVMKMAQEMAELKDRIDSGSALLKELKFRYELIRKDELPDAMQEAGMVAATGKGSFTLADGRKIFLQTDMHVHLTKADKPAFYEWLKENGHKDLIVPHVHPATLKAFCKEQVSEGNKLPDVIITHPFLKAVLRKA